MLIPHTLLVAHPYQSSYSFTLQLLSHSLDGIPALSQQGLIQMLFGLLIGSLHKRRMILDGSVNTAVWCTWGYGSSPAVHYCVNMVLTLTHTSTSMGILASGGACVEEITIGTLKCNCLKDQIKVVYRRSDRLHRWPKLNSHLLTTSKWKNKMKEQLLV